MANETAAFYRERLKGFGNGERRLIVDSFRLHVRFFSNEKLISLENQPEELVGEVLDLFIGSMERAFEGKFSYTMFFTRVDALLKSDNWRAKLLVPHFICAFRADLLGKKDFPWVDYDDVKTLVVVSSQTLLDLVRGTRA